MAWFWFMSKRKLALVLFVVGLITWLLFVLLRQTYFLPYARIIIKLASTDSHRFADNDRILTEQAWRLHAFETRFSQEFYCKDKPGREDVAWLTVLVNDKYLVPTLVLGHALRTFSCQKTMLAFLSEGVSESARTALRKVGWMIRDVEQMDCNWMERQLGRPQLNFGLTGTHTRFHAWNMTEYSKIIHLDPDYMPLAHMDELFSLPGDFYASYCARPGILDPCFNAGMLVFRPDKELHRELMTFWTETSRSHRCLNDQVLLWHLYADADRWQSLPYAYNVRKALYRPMKAFHFSWPLPKPWDSECRPSRREAASFDGPLVTIKDVSLIFWKNLYEALKKYELEEWWETSTFADPARENSKMTFDECWSEHGFAIHKTLFYQQHPDFVGVKSIS